MLKENPTPTGWKGKFIWFGDVKHFNELFSVIESRKHFYSENGKAYISSYCSIRSKSGYTSAEVQPVKTLANWIGNTMIRTNSPVYFKVIERDDGFLITVEYNDIIGSWWLALIPVDGLPKEILKIKNNGEIT